MLNRKTLASDCLFVVISTTFCLVLGPPLAKKLSYLKEKKDASPERIKSRMKPNTAPVLFVFCVADSPEHHF